jgi:hypothetical protein
VKFRLQQIQKCRKLTSELEDAAKRLSLFQKMMEDAGVVDTQLGEEIKCGFRLVGLELQASELSVDE